MKILYLTNNLAFDISEWLIDNGENLVVYHEKINYDFLKLERYDFIISYNYKYIIPENIIKMYENKIINLHISFLPYNRGAHPNVWSFLEDTPKGVTIHYIDEGIDTGDIIVQKELYFDEKNETFKTSYEKLNIEIQNLFKLNWDKIKNDKIVPVKQNNQIATYHTRKDLNILLEYFGELFWSKTISEIKSIIMEKNLI
ncbi:MAG: formyl transferase domain protein [Deferribacteraceae bacterium]|jgi:methionyl-tRNA formyltransferase|nr:formyl transferase domain protein [Deferribacteraceae bacterium]MDK2792564.1 methionyl-tRNA formyltransferase [Deferribacteres bacterium]